MISASYHGTICESYVLGVSFPWPIYGGKDLVPTMLNISGSICFVKNTYLNFERPKLVDSSAVNPEAVIIN